MRIGQTFGNKLDVLETLQARYDLHFNTDADSYHGHPDELRTPVDVKRRSMALYYYTASRAVYREVPNHSTMNHARPQDRASVRLEAASFRATEYLRDWSPPVLFRLIEKVRWRMSSER